MLLSKRSLRLTASWLQGLKNKEAKLKAEGKEIVSLGVGEPQVPCFDNVREEAARAAREEKLAYLPPPGSGELREKIASRYGVSSDRVVVSHGAKPLIAAVLWSIIDLGDNILVPTPHYPVYEQIIRSCSGKPVFMDTHRNRYVLRGNDIAQHLEGTQVKGVIINSPNNPTGAVYDEECLLSLSRVLTRNDVWSISDECYQNYGGGDSFLNYHSESVIINSFSKSHAMPGMRIGWAILPLSLVEAVICYLGNYVGSPSVVAEKAALEALDTSGYKETVFQESREYLYQWLDKMDIHHFSTTGAFYCFADFSPYLKHGRKNDRALVEELLDNGVSVVPGSVFGERYSNFLRISYGVPLKTVTAGVERMEQVLSK